MARIKRHQQGGRAKTICDPQCETIKQLVGLPRASRHLTLASLVGACVLLLTIGGPLDPRLVQGQVAINNEGQPLLSNKLVNLNDILVHQQALVKQCKQLEAEKLAELRRLMELSHELSADLQLDDRVTVKLPAVCLMLIGPPQFGLGDQDGQQPPHELAKPTAASPRLDLVNWIYDYEDLLKVSNGGGNGGGNGSNNKTTASKAKRQAGSLLGEENSPNLLNDLWLDVSKLDSNKHHELSAPASEKELELLKFHEQVDRMLEDDRFKEAIKQVDSNKIAPYLSPVVLVPGLAGSRLQARVVAKKPKVNIICSRQKGWQDVWLTLRSFLPVAIDCWIDNAHMEFDPATGFTRNAGGVESRVPEFGSVESVRHLDLKSPKLTKYFQNIIERYEQLGYQADKNLFAAPYDFRLAPQQLEKSFFGRLKQLIEFAHSNDGQQSLDQAGAASGSRLGDSVDGTAARGKKVTLLCHSMGCTHLLIFLRRQQPAWRQSHIRKLIALSSPWGGSVKALKALLVGEQFGLPLVSEAKMRKLARTFPGVAYMMPQAEIFERPSKDQADFGGQVLVQTPEHKFKVNNLDQLLKAAGMERQWQWFQQTVSLIRPLEPLPDLNVDCLHSLNIPTPETIIFRNSSDFPDGDYELVQGDGDGTVNHQSLLVCGLWASQLPERVRHKIVMNTNHVGMLSHKSTLEHITDDVLGNNLG